MAGRQTKVEVRGLVYAFKNCYESTALFSLMGSAYEQDVTRTYLVGPNLETLRQRPGMIHLFKGGRN